jgi:hypothetical protein
MKEQEKLQEVLAKIALLANSTLGNSEFEGTKSEEEQIEGIADAGCTLKSLPKRLLKKGADTAIKLNPVNAPSPLLALMSESMGDTVPDPLLITLLTSKYWGSSPRVLTVSFMDSPAADLRKRIVSHLNAWTKTACISFKETSGTGQVRISRGSGGFYSYLGTDILHIPNNRQTMNLQGFTMNTPESEFRRVIRHEAGHTLGFHHEHMRRELINRIDRQKAYDYFLRTQGWNRQMVDQQVLTPLDVNSILGTAADQDSIMCYQLPGSITLNGQPIRGGIDINATDFAFAGKIYPRPRLTMMPEKDNIEQFEIWSESEDVPDNEIEDRVQSSVPVTNGQDA